MSIVIVQDEIVHYEVLGRGRPLIFLHSWVGSWRYWIPMMQAASISFRTYALDLWGFGDTAKQPTLYDLEHQVDLLDKFMQEMGIGKIALIGHGLGAVVALQYARRNSKWVDRVMAVSVPNGRHTLNTRLYTASALELVDWLTVRGPESEAVRLEAPKADPRAVYTTLSNIEHLDAARLTQSLTTPTLLVYGLNDPVIEGSASAVEPSLTQPENIHQILFEGSGHFPMLDEMNKFNRLVADFLSLGSGASPRQLQLKDEWRRRVR